MRNDGRDRIEPHADLHWRKTPGNQATAIPSTSTFPAGLLRPPMISVLARRCVPSTAARPARTLATSAGSRTIVVDLHQIPDLHTGSAELRLQIPPRQRALWHLDAIRLLRRPTVRCVQWKQSAATTARHLRYGSAFRLALNIFRPTAIIAYCNIKNCHIKSVSFRLAWCRWSRVISPTEYRACPARF